MAITAAEQTFFNNAINTVFRDDKDDLTYARKLLNQNSDNIPALLTALNKLCGCSFSDKAGLQNSPPPQAVADSISTAVTESGGTPSDAVALKRKVGNAELTTTAKDLSGAVNELDEEIGSATLKTGSSTVKGSINELVDYVNTIAGTDTTLPAAVNALTAKVDGVSTASDSVAGIIGDVPLTTTAQTLSGGITELDGEIGGATLTTDATTVKAAINEVDANADTAQAAVDAVEVILGSSSMASVSSASNTATGIIGNSALITTSQTLSGAINEVLSAGGSSADVYTPIGTLGSFYECSSLTDTSPTLVATGANTIAGMSRAEHKCAIWGFSKLVVTTNKGSNTVSNPDYGDPSVPWDSTQPVFGSFSSEGSCFSISRPGASPAGWNSAVAVDAYMLCIYGLDH